MQIRAASDEDKAAIRAVHLNAFGEDEREMVATLATHLLETSSVPPTLSVVAEHDDSIVGHIAFSPVQAPEAPDRKSVV